MTRTTNGNESFKTETLVKSWSCILLAAAKSVDGQSCFSTTLNKLFTQNDLPVLNLSGLGSIDITKLLSAETLKPPTFGESTPKVPRSDVASSARPLAAPSIEISTVECADVAASASEPKYGESIEHNDLVDCDISRVVKRRGVAITNTQSFVKAYKESNLLIYGKNGKSTKMPSTKKIGDNFDYLFSIVEEVTSYNFDKLLPNSDRSLRSNKN